MNCQHPAEAAQLLAKSLRHEHSIYGRVDVHDLCRRLGIRCESRKLTMDGMLMEDRGGYKVVVNSNTAWSRQRFSIAHELGHLSLFRSTQLAEAFSHTRIERQPLDSRSSEIERLC